MLFGKEGFSI